MKEDARWGMLDGKMHQVEAAYVAGHIRLGRTRAGVLFDDTIHRNWHMKLVLCKPMASIENHAQQSYARNARTSFFLP